MLWPERSSGFGGPLADGVPPASWATSSLRKTAQYDGGHRRDPGGPAEGRNGEAAEDLTPVPWDLLSVLE